MGIASVTWANTPGSTVVLLTDSFQDLPDSLAIVKNSSTITLFVNFILNENGLNCWIGDRIAAQISQPEHKTFYTIVSRYQSMIAK
jgi:hypothetical protein